MNATAAIVLHDRTIPPAIDYRIQGLEQQPTHWVVWLQSERRGSHAITFQCEPPNWFSLRDAMLRGDHVEVRGPVASPLEINRAEFLKRDGGVVRQRPLDAEPPHTIVPKSTIEPVRVMEPSPHAVGDLVPRVTRLHRLLKDAGDVIEQLSELGCSTSLRVHNVDGEALESHDLTGEFCLEVQLRHTIQPASDAAEGDAD